MIDPDRSRAVLIATATYARDDELDDLPEVSAGANALHALLTDPDHGSFLAQHCVTVIDPSDPYSLVEDLYKLAGEATDTLLIYYAGHGLLGPGETLYFGCTDSTQDLPHVRSLHMEWVHDVMRKSPATNRLLIVDCCFSGHALAGTAMTGVARLAGRRLTVDDVDGRWILVSGSKYRPSYILPGARYSGMTDALLQVLTEGIPYRSSMLTLDDVFAGVRIAMRKKELPPPYVSSTQTVSGLALVRNVAHSADAPQLAGSVLGDWWDGVTVRRGGASSLSKWMARRRHAGGPIGDMFNPFGYKQIAKDSIPHLWWLRKGPTPITRAVRNMNIRTRQRTDAIDSLIKMTTDDLPYTTYLVSISTRLAEPHWAKLLGALVTEDPETATTLLRNLLAEHPIKTVRLCQEADLPVPPHSWYIENNIDEPPQHS